MNWPSRMDEGWILVCCAWLTAVWVPSACVAQGQAHRSRAQGILGTEGATNSTSGAVVVEHADEMNYDSDTGWIEARGGVIIRHGDQEIRASRVRVNVETGDAAAAGNVVLKRAAGEMRGPKLEGNFRTGVWRGGDFSGEAKPFRLLHADKIKRENDGTFALHEADLTTCTNAACTHFHVAARDVQVAQGEYLKAWDAVWYFGSVPVMYVPYWYRDLKDNLGYDVQPGYDRRDGGFLLNSYSYRLNPELTAATHLDFRSERGFGVGQDFKWRDRDEKWRGEGRMYYTDDWHPRDEDDEGVDIARQRYRVRLEHGYSLSDSDYALLQAHYLSDPDILDDFFEREIKRSPQPENFFVYTHRGSGYTADMTFRRRLNDFYTDVNRTPEISLNALRQPVGQSGVYYESKSSAGYLEKVWMKSLTNSADYSALRVDSSQMIYYPDMYAGFLSVIPRAGYRLTYYSKTRDQQTIMVDTNTVTEEVEEGPGLRTRPELGAEVSYKAFKTWKGGVISPLRHIAEPYCNYTLAPEPNLLPERLYQFDNVDTLRKDHSLKIGMRNIWQTKHGDLPFDLVDLDTYTRVRIEPNQGEQTWDYFYYDAVVTPSDWLRLKFDGSYDLYGDGFETFNSQATVSQLTNVWTGAAWQAQVEYRLKRGESSLLAFDTTFSPNRRWDLNLNARYEFEDRRLEEIGAFVQRNLDCMAIQPGLNFRPGYTAADGSTMKDEWRFMVEFWLTTFPKARIGNR